MQQPYAHGVDNGQSDPQADDVADPLENLHPDLQSPAFTRPPHPMALV